MKKTTLEWKTYRTRFLVRARQLTEPTHLVDSLGREHFGDIGDYLVESSDGTQRIAPRLIFEDVYVAIGRLEINSVGSRKQKSSHSAHDGLIGHAASA